MAESSDSKRARVADEKLRAIRLSVLVGVVLFFTKALAWLVTGSTAILSDAAESTVNVIAAALAWLSIRVSAMPADENHPYGHGKIEYFSAGFEGGLIVLAAVAILGVAVPRLLYPPPLQSLGLGTLLTAGAAVANLLLALHLLRVGKRTASAAIEADGRHIMTDVVTSVGVVIGLVLAQVTGLLIIDPIVAILVAINILVEGYKIVRASFARLMDEADEPLLERIVQALRSYRRPGYLQPHQLRAKSYGSKLSVDFHIFMPRFWPLTRVHGAVDEIEGGLRRDFGRELEAIIHVDPCRPSHCTGCALDACPVRSRSCEVEEVWEMSAIVSSGEHPEIE